MADVVVKGLDGVGLAGGAKGYRVGEAAQHGGIPAPVFCHEQGHAQQVLQLSLHVLNCLPRLGIFISLHKTRDFILAVLWILNYCFRIRIQPNCTVRGDMH